MKLVKTKIILLGIILFAGGAAGASLKGFNNDEPEKEAEQNDSVPEKELLMVNSLDSLGSEENERYKHLTEQDFNVVAKELGVEVAAIKAVVEIEAGKAMRGFWAPGVPVINFDRSMYNIYGKKAVDKSGDKNQKVPEGLTGYALKEWTQLINARKTNAQGADMGTFWGMFQIGGFNYKICGCSSIGEFVDRMSYSELEQLQLFAVLITNTGMVEYLKKKGLERLRKKI